MSDETRNWGVHRLDYEGVGKLREDTGMSTL